MESHCFRLFLSIHTHEGYMSDLNLVLTLELFGRKYKDSELITLIQSNFEYLDKTPQRFLTYANVQSLDTID